MGRFFLFMMVLWVGHTAMAQKMRDVFAAMPDSILEVMTKNNRLDCIDFIEHGMEARVRNRFDGFTQLKAMTLDYLDLQLTAQCRVEMKLLPAKDSLNYVCMVRTYAGPVRESVVTLYTPEWSNALCAQRAELLFAESVEAPEVLDGIQKTHAFYSTSLYFVLWTRYSGRRTRKSSSGRIPASAAFAASDSRAAISRARSRP